MISREVLHKNTNMRNKFNNETENNFSHNDSLSTHQRRSQEEVVAIFLNSMLNAIVEAWDPLPLIEETSEDEIHSKRKTRQSFVETENQVLDQQLKSNTSCDFSENQIQSTSHLSFHRCGNTLNEERAIIRFRNGNVYEGALFAKCMHGEGRFRWADGTVYEGRFENNEIKGRGTIHWKNDTWYEGEFLGNLRHGHGMYVDPRRQRAYLGDWHCAVKHGKGTMFYDHTFQNSYEGDWDKNIRQGYGIREYGPTSGYEGQWKLSLRDGEGLLVWPNHDIYRGQWKDGIMHGDGKYVWAAFYHNTFSLPSMNVYRGQWERGARSGYGFINLELNIKGHYKGNFKNNLKHGRGTFVLNNGVILQDEMLFKNDDLCLPEQSDTTLGTLNEVLQYNLNDINVSLSYHVEEAFKNLEKHDDIIILKDYLENNQLSNGRPNNDFPDVESLVEDIQDRIEFEQSALRKALYYYEKELRNIYHKYATVLDRNGVESKPLMIRLLLWQMYFDCKVREEGLYLVDVDRLLHVNPEWLTGSAHNPFEKIYFWQFLHSLISVARRLYAKKYMPKYRPDTILGSAFRKLMDEDILPGVFRRSGKLVNGYGLVKRAERVPLKSLYSLYRSIGEPHTIRQFMRAARCPAHREAPAPPPASGADYATPLGRNVYEFEDELCFITDNFAVEKTPNVKYNLKLISFSNLSSKAIIQIFSYLYPSIVDKVLDVTLEITFYEFFEAFIRCAEESVKLN